jgi:hypothetical protein
MHVTRLDGADPDADLEHLRDVVWRHTVIDPWLTGDAVAIDNHWSRTGACREGPRHVVVCWPNRALVYLDPPRDVEAPRISMPSAAGARAASPASSAERSSVSSSTGPPDSPRSPAPAR